MTDASADAFVLYPAIDLRHGKVVRLDQGRDDATTTYGDDPVAVARSFADQGAAAVHVVDLDAAFGDGDHRDVLRQVAHAFPGTVEVGGGIRSDDAGASLLDAGVGRVVIGSAAVEDPALVERLVARFGADRVIVGLDARDGEVKLRGWVEGSARQLHDVAADMVAVGVREVVYTDIARDGMLHGPDLDGAERLAAATGLRVVASGGVGSLDHLADARRRDGVVGIIVGKALYEGRFSVAQALEVVSC